MAAGVNHPVIRRCCSACCSTAMPQGVCSSRKPKQATYDSVAFRYIAANQHPDHDTLAHFRRRCLKELGSLFARLLVLARQMG